MANAKLHPLLECKEIHKLLNHLSLAKKNNICRKMEKIGIKNWDDMKFIDPERDLSKYLTKIEARSLSHDIRQMLSESGVNSASSQSSEAVSSVFDGPMCLVNSDKHGNLSVNKCVLKEVEQIKAPVNVVSIAGLSRTGKSYLLTRLAGKHSGFAVGSNVEAKTKGIWIWCIPHPVNTGEVLVLLDTEGLGDPTKANAIYDTWIFSLAILLSSTLVFNVKGVLDEPTLERLNFITQITRFIKAKVNDKGTESYDLFFPHLVMALRDFTLKLEIKGENVSVDAYLEHTLTLLPEENGRITQYNDIRRCIRRYFSTRKCFTFGIPTASSEILGNLVERPDNDLNASFLKNLEDFCKYIYEQCPGKKLDTGLNVTGRMLADLVKLYVSAITEGPVPCIENTLDTIVQHENDKAAKEAAELYEKRMLELIRLPTNTEDELIKVHEQVLKESISYFMQKTVCDDEQLHQKNLNERIEDKLKAWITKKQVFL